MTKINFLVVVLFLAGFLACQKDSIGIITVDYYSPSEWEIISADLNLPATLNNYQFKTDGRITGNNDIRATLGRVLFYDKRLSIDGEISCSSCHQQSLGFADDVAFSEGVLGNHTDRNSIGLASTTSFDEAYGGQSSAGLFWDESVSTVKAQMEQTFANEKEMGMDLAELASKIYDEPYYQILFRKAYASNDINSDKILDAIEVFIRSIKSENSKFDQANILNDQLVGRKFSEDWRMLSENENRGKKIFHLNCTGCHMRNLSPFDGLANSLESVANNGLDLITKDKGFYAVTKLKIDEGKFKIAGLRNVALTSPYMHDGRFNTLEEVVDFYSNDIQAHPNLSPILKTEDGIPKRMNFTVEDKADLIAFLHTLTDDNLVKIERWSDPFKD